MGRRCTLQSSEYMGCGLRFIRVDPPLLRFIRVDPPLPAAQHVRIHDGACQGVVAAVALVVYGARHGTRGIRAVYNLDFRVQASGFRV
jgi:hypothetical protein